MGKINQGDAGKHFMRGAPKQIFNDYEKEFHSLSEDRQEYIQFRYDTDFELSTDKGFSASKAAEALYTGLISGELSPEFTEAELYIFMQCEGAYLRQGVDPPKDIRLPHIAVKVKGKAGRPKANKASLFVDKKIYEENQAGKPPTQIAKESEVPVESVRQAIDRQRKRST